MTATSITLIIAGTSVGIAGISVGITLVILLCRGFRLWGRMEQKVDGMSSGFDNMAAKLDNIANNIRDLATETRCTNEAVVTLTNHYHDTDGGMPFVALGR